VPWCAAASSFSANSRLVATAAQAFKQRPFLNSAGAQSSLLRLPGPSPFHSHSSLLCARPASSPDTAYLQPLIAVRDSACPSWSTITLGLPTLFFTPSTPRPVFGLPTPRPFRRLARRALLLGRRPRKLKVGCAPASPADAVAVPRSSVSTMALGRRVGRANTEGRTASTLLLRLLDQDDVKVASPADRNNSQTQTGGRSRARTYKPTLEQPLDWAHSKARVPCWMLSIRDF
jgi:hypothetical protein